MISERDESLLNDLLDGRLTDVDRDALRQRMDADPALREAYEELGRVGEMARAFDPASALDVPADFADRVRAQIGTASPATRETPAASDSRGGRLLHMMAFGYAAAAVLVLAVTAFWMLDQRADTPVPEHLADSPPEGSAARDGVAETDLLRKKNAEDLEGRDELEMLDAAAPAVPAGPSAGRLAPGGSVPPGLREPSDVPPPAPTTPPSGDPRVARSGERGDGRPEPVPIPDGNSRGREADARGRSRSQAEPVVYVLEVDDVDAARARIQVLVAQLEADAVRQAERRASGAAPAADAPEGVKEGVLEGVLDELETEAFYRVAPDDPILATLSEVPPTAEGQAAAGMPAAVQPADPTAGREPTKRKRTDAAYEWVGLIEQDLSAAAAERLSALARPSIWSAVGLAAKSTPPSAPAAAKAPGKPTSPGPAGTPPTGAVRPADAEDSDADEEVDRKAESGSKAADKRSGDDRVPVRIVLVKRR